MTLKHRTPGERRAYVEGYKAALRKTSWLNPQGQRMVGLIPGEPLELLLEQMDEITQALDNHFNDVKE